MKIKAHQVQDIQIAEVLSDELLLRTTQDALDLLGDLYFQGFDGIILHEKNIVPQFFDLKTGLAGEILQKFTNYRVKLILIGNFGVYTSKSLKDFIFESNKQGQVVFAASVSEVIDQLAAHQ